MVLPSFREGAPHADSSAQPCRQAMRIHYDSPGWREEALDGSEERAHDGAVRVVQMMRCIQRFIRTTAWHE